jgi:hypothetical protein
MPVTVIVACRTVSNGFPFVTITIIFVVPWPLEIFVKNQEFDGMEFVIVNRPLVLTVNESFELIAFKRCREVLSTEISPLLIP